MNISSDAQPPATPPNDPEGAVRYYCDLQWNAITETATLFSKGVTFFLAIIAVLTGYIAGQKLSSEMQRLVLYLVVGVSAIATTGGVYVAWGLHKGLISFERTSKQLDPRMFDILEINRFFKRGRRVLWFIMICAFLVLVSLIAVLARMAL
jgi:hypothetical protein